LGARPQNGRLCPGPMCTIMQNFTPIGVTVAEISVTGQKDTKIDRYRELQQTSDKTHTSVVNNKHYREQSITATIKRAPNIQEIAMQLSLDEIITYQIQLYQRSSFILQCLKTYNKYLTIK